MSETAISRAIRERLVLERDVLIWRNNSGKLCDARGRWVTFGLGVGSADLIGLVQIPGIAGAVPLAVARTHGRFFALEVKAGKGSTTPEQDAWHAIVRKHGGFTRVVRFVDEAMAALEACRRGEP